MKLKYTSGQLVDAVE